MRTIFCDQHRIEHGQQEKRKNECNIAFTIQKMDAEVQN